MSLEDQCYDYVEIWPAGNITGAGEKYCGREKIPLQTSKGNHLMWVVVLSFYFCLSKNWFLTTTVEDVMTSIKKARSKMTSVLW